MSKQTDILESLKLNRVVEFKTTGNSSGSLKNKFNEPTKEDNIAQYFSQPEITFIKAMKLKYIQLFNDYKKIFDDIANATTIKAYTGIDIKSKEFNQVGKDAKRGEEICDTLIRNGYVTKDEVQEIKKINAQYRLYKISIEYIYDKHKIEMGDNLMALAWNLIQDLYEIYENSLSTILD